MRPTALHITMAFCLLASFERPTHSEDAFLYGAMANLDSLSIETAYEYTERQNPAIASAWAKVRAVEGIELQNRSRLLPHAYFDYRAGFEGIEDEADEGDDLNSAEAHQLDFQIRQRIAEFGKTSDIEWERRRAQRAAVYEYENVLVEQWSILWRTYYSVIITRHQLAEHDSLLRVYSERLKTERERLDNGVARRTTVLTARLNQLEERERILQLQARELELVANLKEVLGAQRLSRKVVLTSSRGPFELREDSCVAAAVHRSTRLADLEKETENAKRRLDQWLWEFLPNMAVSAGIHRGPQSAEVEVGSDPRGSSNRRYAADLVGGYRLIDPKDTLYRIDESLFDYREKDLQYTAGIVVRFPVFQGGRRKGTRSELAARYDGARSEYLTAMARLEENVRSAFYQFELARRKLEIQQERVAIDRERYDLAQIQYDLSRITEDGLDAFREKLFRSQDAFFGQQFTVLEKENTLRRLIRIY